MTSPGSSRRVAFFGGSFDPPHLAHLAVARAARAALSLDMVLFAPVGAQPLKPQGSTAAFEDRLAMTRLAIAGEPGFAISLADAPQPSGTANYTISTLERLQAELGPAQLFCLMGADSFFGLRQWHRAAEIPFAAQLIVASRPGQPLGELRLGLPGGLNLEPVRNETKSGIELSTFQVSDSAGRRAPFYLLPGLHIETSASAIRAQVRATAEGLKDASSLLAAPVADYIRAHNLYR